MRSQDNVFHLQERVVGVRGELFAGEPPFALELDGERIAITDRR